MAKYLITGAAGFISSKVRELLLVKDHEVIGVNYLNDSYDVRLKRHLPPGLCPYPLL